MPESSLVLENLGVMRGKKTILRDVSLNVPQGECLGIVGPNGSGKSTLLEAILGYLPLSAGSIQVQGQMLVAMSAGDRSRSMAYVAQDATQLLSFTVEAFLNLAYFPWRKTLDPSIWEADRERLCIDFKLQDKLPRDLNSLSGGERQRVLLVQSLLQRPQILLLDEITNHLDIAYQLETLQFLRKLPLTKIMVLHDMNLAARFCDRLILLKEGSCLAAGPTIEVLTEHTLQELFGVSCEILRRNGRIHHIIFGSECRSAD